MVNVARNSKTYFGLHVKCAIFVPDFSQVWSYQTDFRESPQYQIQLKSVQREPR